LEAVVVTEAEIANYKEKVKKLITDHLKLTVNYPNCNNQQILTQLKPIWIKIEEANLKYSGMSFQAFVQAANNAAMLSEMKNFFGG
jgi:hypothetical protein